MREYLQSSAALWVLRLATLAMLLAVGIYIVSKVRAGMRDAGPSASELMSEFRDLHSRGELSDEEYKTIKGTLSGRLQKEIKETEDKG